MKKKKHIAVLVEMNCPRCGSDMDVLDSGKYKGKDWVTFKCPKCKFIYNEEEEYKF